MTSSHAKSKQIIGYALSDAFFLKFSYLLMSLNIQTDGEQFTLTTKRLVGG